MIQDLLAVGTGQLVFVTALVVIGAVAALLNPVFATVLLVVLTFVRSALQAGGPVDPFLLAFALLAVSVALWIAARPSDRLPVPGAVEAFGLLYILWNVASMIVGHRYPPLMPWFTSEVPVARMIVISPDSVGSSGATRSTSCRS